jgi:hypothetical protein
METKRKILPAILLMLLGASATSAPKHIVRLPVHYGVWNPLVGSGAAYQIETRDGRKWEMEIAVVGSEAVEGRLGYWVESVARFEDEHAPPVRLKYLKVLEGNRMLVKRLLRQVGNSPPKEFPVGGVLAGNNLPVTLADVRGEHAELIGSESVSTPSGVFTCEHYRFPYRMGMAPGDAWFSEKIAPYSVVKATGPDGTMTMVRVLSNTKHL